MNPVDKEDTTYGVTLELTVCSDIEEAARCIIGTSTKGIAVREELNGVNVRIMCSKSLDTFLLSNIPELCKRITGARHELIGIKRVYAQTHNISKMVGKFVYLGSCLKIPEDASHVARGC